MVSQLPPGPLRAIAVNLLAEIRMYDNSFVQAAELLEPRSTTPPTTPAVLVQSLLSCRSHRSIPASTTSHCVTRSDAASIADELDFRP